ncbi:2-hydroxyacid dehydrogenase [Simiduia agarivorans]|uniref:D-lactate dehydrogenase n=1 Tax=Simiduia agarivorans (strain DSM 21679 / JCM 13881 / BCRC 17597 / SA1) TaxID=1117647 RepID=K4KJQ0_SIMAS|nr:2-hydroxyacid dehydrogenase [Simiduia agarivorans]AFU99379.1 D-lactate dehydrogenase [Simiduia agarivorans SA1 = DSM 21679]
MDITFFSTKKYDRASFNAAIAQYPHINLRYLDCRLDATTAALATGADAVCAFVNDKLDAECIGQLAAVGIRLVLLRCAGFNQVDLAAASAHNLVVARVPAYAPEGVAEHAVGLILALNRKLCKAHARVRENNFSLENLQGFNLHGCTVGVVGTGKIGAAFARIMLGFGCNVLAHDPTPDSALTALGVNYVPLDALCRASRIVSLHCPLTPATRYLIDDAALSAMPAGVMLINTSRGGLVDTRAVIKHLKTGHLGYLGLDVYEEEAGLFFEDESDHILQDDVFARLQTFPNVLITGHQAFLTQEALANIAETSLANAESERQGIDCGNRVSAS